ncbi:hypothetical protein Tco_0505657, partial [Tanacetum coccineum]
MSKDTIQLETAVLTISPEYLLEFTSEYGISEDLHPELPGPEERIMDFPDGKRINAPKDEMLVKGSYSAEDVAVLNIRRDDVYLTFLNDDDRGGCFALNPIKVKTGTRPHTAHEVPLLTVTANRVIDMEDPVATMTSSETPSVMEKSPLDFSSEDPPPMII